MSTNVKFHLTLTVEGTSLEEIDNGLVQAAGQRLMARFSDPNQKIPGLTHVGPINQVSSSVPAAAQPQNTPQRVEIPAKVEEHILQQNTSVQTHPQTVETSHAHIASHIEQPDQALTEKIARPKGRPSKKEKTDVHAGEEAKNASPRELTKDDAIAALKSVTDVCTIDKARQLMALHGVSKLSEMDPKVYGKFINDCKNAVENMKA